LGRKALGFYGPQRVHEAIAIDAMTTRKEKSMYTENANRFTVDELGFIQLALTEVLAAVARGELDLNKLAREELAARGLDQNGQWVGFQKAAEIHKV